MTVARSISQWGFGFTPAEQRSVKPMPQWVYNLVPRPTGTNETIKSNEDTERDTMPLIRNKVKRTLYHTEKLAERLKGSSVEDTTRKVWQFVFDYIKYVPDAEGCEQVRSPRRTIYDRKGDCDCMVVLTSSLLLNLRIPHFLRIMKQYSAADQWGHIYIIVPKNGSVKSNVSKRSDYIAMDCVVNEYDKEADHVEHKDFPMALQSLDGVTASGNECKSNSQSLKYYERSQQYRDRGLVIAEDFLLANRIPYTVVDGAQYGFVVGKTFVPPIITPQEASILLTPEIQDATPDVKPMPTSPSERKNCNWLWWTLGGAAAAYLWTKATSE